MRKSKLCIGINCDVFVLCQSIVDTGIGLLMFVVCICGCSVTAVDDESENTGRSISRKNQIRV